MIKGDLLDRLSVITKEEQLFLNGEKNINRSFYMTSADNVVNFDKFSADGSPVAMRPHTRFVYFPEHTHDYIEMVYMCSGNTNHILDGCPLLLLESELLIINNRTSQEILPAGKNDIAINFIIKKDFFEDIIKLFALKLPTDFVSGSKPLHFSFPDVLPVHNLIENLIWFLTNTPENYVKLCQYTLGTLLASLFIRTNTSETSLAINHVMSYIDKHFKDGQLKNLANELHYDFSWLSREIKIKTGKTYTDLVQEKRLSEACFLLRNTNMNISDISLSVGYNNISYFHKLFGKTFGMSPRKYRMLP